MGRGELELKKYTYLTIRLQWLVDLPTCCGGEYIFLFLCRKCSSSLASGHPVNSCAESWTTPSSATNGQHALGGSSWYAHPTLPFQVCGKGWEWRCKQGNWLWPRIVFSTKAAACRVLKADGLGSNPGSATYWLCDIGKYLGLSELGLSHP